MKGSPFPILETDRLRLRSPKDEDIPHLLKISQDEDVMIYYGVEPYKSEEEAEKEVDWMLGIYREKKGIRWVITLKESDEYVGDVGVDKLDMKHRKGELGFKLVKKHWRRGVMTEALTRALDHVYDEMGLNRVEALVDPRNDASWALLRKIGFKEEGVLREYEFEKGEYIDLIMTSLLRREWKHP
ncbi:MAG TPA: GNAT family protein [Patescibacteria group bacterium]|nr:GNAT family protein [Patescibacteria group bacterium]